jgi:EmrB/QacA subfamily drug resistance transporter
MKTGGLDSEVRKAEGRAADFTHSADRFMPQHNRIITVVVASALFMQNLDSTVLGTALATIAGSLRTDPVRLHMAMTGYLLSLAVFMPVSGWLADRWGARTVFRLAVAIFTLASVGCAFAPTLGWLVAGRVVQGAGGAMMLPVARLALLRAVPKDQLINAMAWVSIPALVGPVLGPPVGGFIVTYWSWPWIFGINVPIGIAGMVLASLVMDDTREEQPGRFDLVGAVLVGASFAGLMLGFETIGDALMPRWANLLAVLIGLAAMATYIGHARRTPNPVLDLSLLKVPTFYAATVGGGLFRIGIGALPFLLPLMLQAGFGYTPLASGMTTFAAAMGALTMKFGAERLINRFGFRRTLIWNAFISAFFLAACMFFTPSTPVWLIFAVLLVGGFFRSLTFTAVNTIAYAELEPRRMSRATAFAAVAQQLSLSIGIGLAATLLDLVRGGETVPTAHDFVVPFAVVGLAVALSAIQFAMLSPDAGNEVASRRRPADAGRGSSEPAN